jgi:hypothetical protein
MRERVSGCVFMKYRVVLQVADITKGCTGTKEVGRVHSRRCGEPKIDNGRVTDGERADDTTIRPILTRSGKNSGVTSSNFAIPGMEIKVAKTWGSGLGMPQASRNLLL